MRLVCPDPADVPVEGEATQGLAPRGEVAGGQEVAEMAPQLVVGVGIIASGSCIPESPAHALHLPVRPGAPWLGQTMISDALGTGVLKDMSPEDLPSSHGGSRAGVLAL